MRAILIAAAAALAAGGAAAQDAEAGRALAERWCAACHVVAEGQGAATDIAPAFPVIAADPARTDAWLRGWIADPHPPMPDPGLSRAQIEDVVAYLSSLRPD
jgi:mono/diheme cytochrome c family protein